MSLEPLKGKEKIGGIPVTDKMGHFSSERPIIVDHDKNVVAFKIQQGPIKEVGENGCQVDTLIETAKIMLEGLNSKFPCDENLKAIGCLDHTLKWLAMRKAIREARGVEGTSKV